MRLRLARQDVTLDLLLLGRGSHARHPPALFAGPDERDPSAPTGPVSASSRRSLPQASTSTLAETLAALEAAQLVAHHTAEAAPTSTYTLTASGEKLLSRLRRLLDDIHRVSASIGLNRHFG